MVPNVWQRGVQALLALISNAANKPTAEYNKYVSLQTGHGVPSLDSFELAISWRSNHLCHAKFQTFVHAASALREFIGEGL